MGALLVKEAPENLHNWLKDEALYNRRSLNQQILICLEWCMKTYGKAQVRNPFASVQTASVRTVSSADYPRGRELASRINAIAGISDEDAEDMKVSVQKLRSSKMREHDYGCFA